MDFGTELGGSAEDAFGHFGQFKQLKMKYPDIKVLISVGGWSWSKNFSGVAADHKKEIDLQPLLQNLYRDMDWMELI